MKMMKKIIEQPSWLNDGKLFLKDLVYFLRDTVNDATHLIVRGIKLVTLISIWSKDLSKMIEDYLKSIRTNLNMKL